MTPGWYVVTKSLSHGGKTVAGPYKSESQACMARLHYEAIDGKEYGLHEEHAD